MAKQPAATQKKSGPVRKTARRRIPADTKAAAAARAKPDKNTSSPSAKIRMYRHGLGDCFLITLQRPKSVTPYRILIDCGVILGTPDALTKMTNVVNDIVAESKDNAKDANGKIDLLLATHQHWDHLSGFVQAADAFKKLDVENVWLAWTEDPNDALAQKLKGEHDQALTSLKASAAAMHMAGYPDEAAEVDDLIGFFGAAGTGTTPQAMANAAAKGKVRYCLPQDLPIHLDDPDVNLYILGPPHDEKLIKKTLPSAKDPETYGIAALALEDSVMAALSTADNAMPFDDTKSIPIEVAQGMDFFKKRYWGQGEDASDWRRIDVAWLDGASGLALALDAATNNTSLVLAIELADGPVLLFAADAQVGNWLSWQGLSWTFNGRTVTGPDLLARTIFYKVGHHGSHNATLREKGLAMMKQLSIAAIPVDHDMAIKKRWGKMPLPELLDALTAAAKICVLRSDETPSNTLANVEVKDLYFDISI